MGTHLTSQVSVSESERLAREIASISPEHALAILTGAAEALIRKEASKPHHIQYVCQSSLIAGTRLLDSISMLKSAIEGRVRGNSKCLGEEVVQLGASQSVVQMAG